MKNYRHLEEQVISKQLCCYCGTCVGICPEKSITLNNRTPQISGKCINCGECIKNCPGNFFDYCKYNQTIFNADISTIDKDLGYHKGIFCGHSCDLNVREQSSSGGIITSILCGLFEQGIINGAVVVNSENDIDLNCKVAIETSISGIKMSTQSKYVLTANNVILSKLKDLPGRYAYVGLPCQIQGLRKAQINHPWLEEKIVLSIGLFCGFTLYPEATEFLLKKLKMKNEALVKLKYRGGKGTGGFLVEDDVGRQKLINKHAYTFLNIMYSPYRCWKCHDFTSEFADISVGDAWEKSNGSGWSRVITRSDIGESYLNFLSDKNYIFFEKSKKEHIYNTQGHLIMHKKKWIWIRAKLIKNMPDYNIKSNLKQETTHKEALMGFLMFCLTLLLRHQTILNLMQYIPLKALTTSSESIRNILRGFKK